MMKRVFLLIHILSAALLCQMLGDYNHPELKWKNYESEHFIFIYHNGTEKSVLRFADVGEKVYGPITELYNYKPDGKLRVVVADFDDTANGGAYYYTDKMVLWAPSFDTELRGNHFWYANVFTHEFTHMIHLQVSRKSSQVVPGLYFQWTGYESEKREDVLTGFPNVLASASLPFNIIPPWFAEGIAQSQAIDTLYYDFWDSNRDMVFRERLMSGQELRYEQLLDFINKSSHEAETIYNTGYAFVQYIYREYGKKALYDITKEMSRLTSFTFEQAVERAVGINAKDLYAEFIEKSKAEYALKTSDITVNLKEGKDVSDSAYVNSHPKFSPDGRYLSYLSTKKSGEATFYRRDLWIKDLKTDSVKMIVPAVLFSSYSWSPDSKKIYFSRIDSYSVYGNQFLDIFEYDIEKEKEEKITEGQRAANPEVSPDGTKIAYVATEDGTRNIYIYNLLSGESKKITDHDDGTQFFLPQWNREGDKLLIDRSGISFGRDIVLVDTLGTETELISGPHDDRDPVFSHDFASVYFSSDRTGIFNIYRYDLTTGETLPITNVRGGALYPDVNGTDLIYANYKGIRMNIHSLGLSEKGGAVSDYRDMKILSSDYRFIPEPDRLKKSENYGNEFEHILIIPRIAFDDGKFKPGIYFMVNDYLEKISLFGGFGYAPGNGDYDIFAMAEYKFLLPTLYGLGINVVKHDDNSFLDESIIVDSYEDESGNDIPIYQENGIDFTYDLKEFDFGVKTPMTFMPKLLTGKLGKFDFDGYFAYIRNDAKGDYGDYILQYTYYKERSFHFNFGINRTKFDYNDYINPRFGRNWKFTYSRHLTDFIQGFSLNSDYGTLQEDYLKYNYNFYTASLNEHFGLPFGTGMTLKLKGAYLDDDDIDSFYYNYLGGLTGLKGYSFYSLGGTKTLYSGLYLRFPIVERTDKRLGFYNFKNLYLGLFAEAGTAWTTEEFSSAFDDLRKDIGINVRLFGSLFYGMPMSVEFSAAYGLDEFESGGVDYGGEIRHYLTVLFDFPEF
ncbi:MAG TPA: DPP IV N-terminal domain-containing protein [Clostridiales bacterium]|nr:DPP IV N-terminal domain-containing protein [Clostridiales bacterium]